MQDNRDGENSLMSIEQLKFTDTTDGSVEFVKVTTYKGLHCGPYIFTNKVL